ncbi:hypothetical protein CYMTET_45253 [Cymbomonas tetramitiformis]|uniref:Uncharacterized protein n=1 Tax=Cymbomonas tetramitiformis TaxID=36881 RepID=A0AAE0BYK1_9CHLO|nr:hypothetical protein CYMTET_45253 [Cymbomonas tetramitiformis]
MRELLEKGAEVDTEDREGRTALTVALAFGQEAAARALLEAGAGVNAGSGQRPLHAAAEKGTLEMVRELVEKGAEVGVEDGEGRTALTVALAGGKEGAARALLEAGASVGEAGRSGFCALGVFLSALVRTAMLAVLRGPAAGKLDGSALVFPSDGFQTFGCAFTCKIPSRQVYYELVILKPLTDPQFGFVDASFELSSASGGSGVDVIDFTLGVFPAFTAFSGAVSVHMLACEMQYMPPDHIAFGDECDLANVAQLDDCDLRVVEILAERLAGRHSHCTLRLLATLGLSDITRLLLENGAASADAAGPVHEGVTALDLARKDGVTPLCIAAQNGQKEVVDVLLAKGAQVDLAQKDGVTPLIAAALKGQKEVVDVLLSLQEAALLGCSKNAQGEGMPSAEAKGAAGGDGSCAEAALRATTRYAHAAACAAPCGNAHCGSRFAETWDEGATFHCFSCKRAIAHQRCAAERAAMEAVKQLDAARASPGAEREAQQVGRGVRVGWLKAFAARAECKGLATWEVVGRVVKPATEKFHRCRYVELPEMAGEVGRATVFVSHTWGARLVDTVAAIAHVLDDDAFVWLDIFAVRQWPGNQADLDFESLVRDTDALLLCAVHLDSVAQLKDAHGRCAPPEDALKMCAFFRVWCLVELAAALHNHKPVVMLIGAAQEEEGGGGFLPNTSMCQNLYFMIDVRNASASVEADRVRILDEVERNGGGCAAVNALARGAVSGTFVGMHEREVLAAACGNPAPLEALCSLQPVGERHVHALCAAAAYGFMNPLRSLIATGVGLDNANNASGATALMHAAEGGHGSAVCALLDGGANPNLRRDDGWAPLSFAAVGGHVEALRVLRDAGADLSHADNYGSTSLAPSALHFASAGLPHPTTTLDSYLGPRQPQPSVWHGTVSCIPRRETLGLVLIPDVAAAADTQGAGNSWTWDWGSAPRSGSQRTGNGAGFSWARAAQHSRSAFIDGCDPDGAVPRGRGALASAPQSFAPQGIPGRPVRSLGGVNRFMVGEGGRIRGGKAGASEQATLPESSMPDAGRRQQWCHTYLEYIVGCDPDGAVPRGRGALASAPQSFAPQGIPGRPVRSLGGVNRFMVGEGGRIRGGKAGASEQATLPESSMPNAGRRQQWCHTYLEYIVGVAVGGAVRHGKARHPRGRPEPPDCPMLGLDWFKGTGQREKSLRYMAWRGWHCALELTGTSWRSFMGTPVATFAEAASIISNVYGSEGSREACSFFEVISDDSCAYWDIDRKVELPEPVSLEALDAHHRETLALSVAGIKAFLEREYVGQEDTPDEAFLVLGACTKEKSSFHVLLRKRLGGPIERGEFRRRLRRQKAAAEPTTTVTGIADLLRWVDEAPYGKTQCFRTALSCKTGKRNWLLPVEGWGATADLEDFFVTNVPADAETLRPAGEEVGGAILLERAPGATGVGSAVEGALHALAPGEAATAEGLARMAVTRLQGHEGARTWGAPKALEEGGASVYFVNGPDGRACAVWEGETHRSNNFCVRVSAAGELWYHCLAGTCSGRRRLQPPRAVDEDAELAGAPAVAQPERAGKWRQISADRSEPDVAETGSHAERHAVSSGTVGQATPMSAADDSPPPGQPAAGRAGVTGLEQQRTTGKSAELAENSAPWTLAPVILPSSVDPSPPAPHQLRSAPEWRTYRAR